MKMLTGRHLRPCDRRPRRSETYEEGGWVGGGQCEQVELLPKKKKRAMCWMVLVVGLLLKL